MDLAKWQKENGQYLAASLTWLRLLLTQFAAQTKPPAPPPGGRFHWRKPGETRAETSPKVREAAAARDEAAKMVPPPALYLLADQLRLTPFERDIVLLCAAMELDTRMPGLCARAMGNTEQTYPTFALALSLFDSPGWDSLSAQRPLRFWRILDVNPAATQPLTAAPLRADERIVNYVKGLNSLDQRLSLLMTAAGTSPGALPLSQQAKVDEIVARWREPTLAETPPAAILLGLDSGAKLLVAQAVCERMERTLYRIGADALPLAIGEIENLARVWQRETALLPLTLYIDAQADGASADHLAALDRFVMRAIRCDGFFFVGTREPLARAGFYSQAFDIARPTASEQHAEWRSAMAALPEDRRAAAGKLSGQFSLNCSDIRRIVADSPADPLDTLPDRLWDQCRDRSRPRLDTLAQRIDPRATWDDLVVTEDTRRLLHEIVAQVTSRGQVYEQWQFARRMNRGLGISALFTGDSGTGKTMAAEVIANDLRLALYRIDLAQVVSKYIGETEKNLQRVFDVMEGGGSILFFDEADALFGKRSEVRDSHDRYANIEVNYLLQRMETYTGLAILATNMKGALDQAFVRRLRFIVPFSFPGPVERRLLWQKVFPEAVPAETLDYERLSRLNLTGAGIHSVALNAAFLAARDKGRVTMPLILLAARTEFRKMERPASEAEFRA